MPPRPTTQISRMPAMKNNAPHTSEISMVWPKSGCSTSTPTTPSSSSSENVVAGISGLRAVSANSQDVRITKDGLRNSDGWMLTPARTIQRRAPFTSAPTNSVATTSAKLTMKTTRASLRIWRGDRNDIASMTAIAGTRYSTWRWTK